MNERWNHNRRSIERLVAYEPDGCFIAETYGEPVGNVFSFNYGNVGWIGMLIVDEKHRRTGVGTLLMKRAMNHLLSLGVETIKLEAVAEIAGLYRKLGFVDEFDSLRFKKTNKKDDQTISQNIELLRRKDVGKIAEFDQKYFGADRTRVLHRLLEDNEEFCFTSRKDNRIIGYIMCYNVETGYRIGPWVCNPHYRQAAKALIQKCMKTIELETELYAGVPAVNGIATNLLRNLGFELYHRNIRMYFGKKLENERVKGIFSIGGPENG